MRPRPRPGGLSTHATPAGFGAQWGYYTDTTTGLLCLTHRYYDPGTGRFINRDPIGYNGGVNLYELAGGNPVNGIDPSGLDPNDDDLQNGHIPMSGLGMMHYSQDPGAVAGAKKGSIEFGKFVITNVLSEGAGKFAEAGLEALASAWLASRAARVAHVAQDVAPAIRTRQQAVGWAANIVGNTFETDAIAALNQVKNDVTYAGRTLSGRMKPFVPEVMDGSFLTEIKQGKRVVNDAQVQAERWYAAQNGLGYRLIVGPNTVVAPKLVVNIRAAGGLVLRFDPETKIFSPY